MVQKFYFRRLARTSLLTRIIKMAGVPMADDGRGQPVEAVRACLEPPASLASCIPQPGYACPAAIARPAPPQPFLRPHAHWPHSDLDARIQPLQCTRRYLGEISNSKQSNSAGLPSCRYPSQWRVEASVQRQSSSSRRTQGVTAEGWGSQLEAPPARRRASESVGPELAGLI